MIAPPDADRDPRRPTSASSPGGSTRVRCLDRFRSQPAPEPGEHLGPHLRRVGVADLRVEDAPEAVGRTQRLVRAPDGPFEGADSVGRRAGVSSPVSARNGRGAISASTPSVSKCLSSPLTK